MTGIMRIIEGFLILSFCVICICGDNSTEDAHLSAPNGNETWIAVEKDIGKIIQRLIKELLPTVMKMRDEIELSGPCGASLMQFVFGLRGMRLWALKMLDASAKPTPGILMGSFSAMGSYRECLAIESDGRNPFRGQYCTVEVAPILPEKPEYVPMYNHDIITKNNSPKISLVTRLKSLNSAFYIGNISIGVCIPSECNEKDLEAIVEAATRSYKLRTRVSRCDIEKEKQFSQEQIFVISVLILISALVVVGTMLDAARHLRANSTEKQKGRIQGLMLSFSVNNSIRKLLSKTSIETCSLLHGIHTLSIIWIIIGITYKTYGLQYSQYAFDLEEENTKLIFETIPGSRNAYNTLYFLSGVVTAYFALKTKEEKRFNSFMFVLLRYLRLTPIVLFSLGFIILLPLFGAGPIWEQTVVKGANVCQNSWWTNILYISNWWKYEDSCALAFRYASGLFQLHIVALILISVLYRYVRIGIILLFALASASVVSIAVLTYEYRLFPTVTKFVEEGFQKLYFEKISLQPHCHMGAYVVGIFVGYMLVKHLTISLKAIYQIVAWVFATGVCLAVVYYPHYSHRRDVPVVTETTILTSVYRIGWCISLGWITFACATGRAGVINRFLSSQLFVPLSRLSHLGFFLLEYIILIRHGSIQQTHIYSHYNMAYEVFGHTFMVLLISLVGYILVDAPVSSILQQFIDNFSRQKADLKKESKIDLQKVQLKTIMVHSRE